MTSRAQAIGHIIAHHEQSISGLDVIRGNVLVGTVLFHGTADRDTAGEQINTQLMTIASALITAMGGDASLLHTDIADAFSAVDSDPQWSSKVVESRQSIEKSPLLPIWDNAVSPVFNEWAAFYHDRKHWYDAITSFFTSWEDYQSWFQRINALRDVVEAAGVRVDAPRMQALSKSAAEQGEELIKAVLGFMKVVGWVALAIGGFVVVATVLKK